MHIDSQGLDMSNMDGHARRMADVDEFLDSALQTHRIGRLVAQMGVVKAAPNRGLLGQRDDFVLGGIALRRIEQARREPERSFTHALADHVFHRLELVSIRRLVRISQHHASDGPEADIGGDIGTDAFLVRI